MKKTICVLIAAAVFLSAGCKNKSEKYVKIGLLHSLSGTMAISETAVRDAELLAIKEINEAGGVLGKLIKPIEEDGKSNPIIFEIKARKLLEEDKVASIFGCWTSDSRKAVKHELEEYYGLLWYPVQYEGMEASPNIMYMGAAPNQQVIPAIDYCASHIGKKMYLIGSDYNFPKTANKIIKAQVASLNGEICGEEYFPLGDSDFFSIIQDIEDKKPDVIINTLNGSSNLSFFHQLKDAGITPNKIPVMSFSIAEGEVKQIGKEYLKNQLVAWNYYETIKNPVNEKFVADYKAAYGNDTVTSDPVEAAHIAVHLWAKACEKAGSFDVEAVRMAAKGITFDAPEGTVKIDGTNQHIYRYVRIGRINTEGLIDEIWTSSDTVKPDPYLSTYEWARGMFESSFRP